MTERLGGIETRPGRLQLAPSWQLEVDMFPEYYAELPQQVLLGLGPEPLQPDGLHRPGHLHRAEALARDIENLRDAIDGLDVVEAFMPASAPTTFGINEHYATSEEYVVAIAEAMREEYRAIVDAGFLVQVDDPFLIDLLMEAARAGERGAPRVARAHIEVVNHALRGIPPEQVRLHTCYGLNHGPRLHDVPLDEVVDLMLTINAGAYSFEVGNPRHQHEWRVWEDTKLPEGRLLIPGFLCHAHNFVEHPRLIADGIITYARMVGRENVIAGADCGFSSRAIYAPEVHPTVAWAKLAALVEGARIASAELWP